MIWLLLVLYQIKHFVADYPLQNDYMLGKFKGYPDYVKPLLAHVAVHGVFSFAIAACFRTPGEALALGLFDAAIHFAVDRVKASPEMGGRFKALTKKDFEEHMGKVKELREKMNIPDIHTVAQLDLALQASDELNEEQIDWAERRKSNKLFWWALGADQTAHHLTHYLLIWGILS